MDLRAHVEEAATSMALQAAARGLELVVDVALDVPERVLGDPGRIRQALTNLVSNAIKFTAHGEVVIRVRTDPDRGAASMVRFEVQDTGVGISEATLPRLFQPFMQADASTAREYGGTGLGLSIVKRLAELMEGRTGVQSTLGKGSTFWFTARLESHARAARAGSARPFPAASRRVLVVDDNDTNRRVLAGQLRHAGYEVEVAETAIAALSTLQTRRQCRRSVPGCAHGSPDARHRRLRACATHPGDGIHCRAAAGALQLHRRSPQPRATAEPGLCRPAVKASPARRAARGDGSGAVARCAGVHAAPARRRHADEIVEAHTAAGAWYCWSRTIRSTSAWRSFTSTAPAAKSSPAAMAVRRLRRWRRGALISCSWTCRCR